MADSEKTGLESATVFVLSSGDPINPATITFINVPDYEHTGSGSFSLGGSFRVSSSKRFNSSWSILGTFKSGFDSGWSIGEGEYYWYRVEGSCGESRCDTTGIKYETCRKMTFMTVVGARNLTELCQTLSNPSINPKVDFRISSIKKYSRPFERSSSDDCNTLDEQEFCNVSECSDFCIDYDAVQKLSFSMNAIESSFYAEMVGGVRLYGQAETDRNRLYEPSLNVIGFGGLTQFKMSLNPAVGNVGVALSGKSENVSRHYVLHSSGQELNLGGHAATVSPRRSYAAASGLVELHGGGFFLYSPSPSGGVAVSGSSSNAFSIRFVPSGSLGLEGRLIGYTSSSFVCRGSGSALIQGSASYNFEDYGTLINSFGMEMSSFGFGSESYPSDNSSSLTIAGSSVSPSCGCGPVGLSLTLRHNMSNSSYIATFLKRSGLSMDDSVTLRYRSSDSSWSHARNFSGRGRDGSTSEELSMFYSMSCSEGFWTFSFSAVNINRTIGKDLHTKFIIDIPADIVCSDGSISTVIGLDINNGGLEESFGRSIPAVTPSIPVFRNPRPRSVDVYVDGIFNEKRIYYDDIGLFKDSYWNTANLEMSIETRQGTRMPEMEIYRIFT